MVGLSDPCGVGLSQYENIRGANRYSAGWCGSECHSVQLGGGAIVKAPILPSLLPLEITPDEPLFPSSLPFFMCTLLTSLFSVFLIFLPFLIHFPLFFLSLPLFILIPPLPLHLTSADISSLFPISPIYRQTSATHSAPTIKTGITIATGVGG